MTKDEYLAEKADEWAHANALWGCGCPNGHPPCSFCVEGYSLPLEEFLEYALEEFTEETYANYERAMKVLDL